MQVPVGSLRHNLWQLTFLNEEKPIRTTRRRFWLRVVLLLVPSVIVIYLFIVLWAVMTLAGNLMTILSGTGIFVTWGKRSFYLDEFYDFPIGKTYQVPPQLVAAILWACVGLALLGYFYPDGFMMYGSMTAKVVFVAAVIGSVSLWAIERANKAEDDDLTRITNLMIVAINGGKPVPDEIVTFVDPPVRPDEVIDT